MKTLVRASGGMLAYAEAGEGMPLVLLHGSPGDGRSWARMARHLPADFRAVMPDLPGHGGSDPVGGDPATHTAALAAAIGALIAELDGKVWLAGHSYGGNVALHVAAAAPGRLRGLVLFEPVFARALDLTGASGEHAAMAAHFEDYTARVAAGENAAIARMIDYWFGPGAFARLPAPAQDYLCAAAPKNAVDVRATFAEALSREALGRIACPVLIAYGGASPPVAAAIAGATAGLLPDARVEVIPGAAHDMPERHPEALARLIAGLAGSADHRG